MIQRIQKATYAAGQMYCALIYTISMYDHTKSYKSMEACFSQGIKNKKVNCDF